MRAWNRWHGIGCLLLLGCTAAPQPTVPPPPSDPPPRAPSVSSVSAPPESPPPPYSLRLLEAAPAPDPMPHVEVQFPMLGRAISVAKAPAYPIRMTVKDWSLGAGRAVLLKLDHHPAKTFTNLDPPPTLGQLVPADRDLEPGMHRLFVGAVDASGRLVKPVGRVSRGPFSVVRFRVGESAGAIPPDRPEIIYSQPRGTFNSDAAADAVFIDYFLVGAELGAGLSIAVEVSGRAGPVSRTLERWQPVAVDGLPSGDFDVRLELRDEAGQSISHAQGTITVNRDAPQPPPARATQPLPDLG